MNDVEHDLRELLDRKAGSVGTVAPRLPVGVRARSRRHQFGTALVAGMAVAALVVGSFGALRAIGTGADRQPMPADDPWAGYEVFEHTAMIENFTITSPSDWYLVNQWPLGASLATTSTGANSGSCEVSIGPGEESSGDPVCVDGTASPAPVDTTLLVPILQLSSDDVGLGTSPCAIGGPQPKGDDAVLEVAIDPAVINAREAGEVATSPAWPVRFDEGTTEQGTCGQGHYVRFEVGNYPYVAFATFGPAATEDDRRTLFDAFATMQVTDWTGTAPSSRTPGYVIAGGKNAAGPWRLELQPSGGNGPDANVDLQLVGAEGTGPSLTDVAVPDAPIEQAGGDPVFGAVVKHAEAVELRLDEGTPTIPAQLVPLPPSMPFDFDLFFASNEADVQAAAVAIGPNGEELGTEEAPPPTISGNPQPTPADRRRVAEGTTGDSEWALEYDEGQELALVGSSEDILFDRIAFNRLASLSAENPMLIGMHDFGTTEQALFLVYGVTHQDVDQLVITLANGQVFELGRGTMRDPSIHIFGQNPNVSPGVWWVQMPPGPVVANVTAFDGACHRLGRAGLALRPQGTDVEVATIAECLPLGG